MLKGKIGEAITGFESMPTRDAALALFDVLGYHSDKTVNTQSVEEFLETFDQLRQLNRDKALVSDWRNANCLFQITNDDVQHTEQAVFAFEDASLYKSQIIESYLFLSIDLQQDHYTRTALAQVTRAVNSLFAMPALILFRHNHHFTLSVINRRLHKRDKTRDVLEKVTLIKDVSIEAPHRAHIEILHDLALPQLQQRHNCRDFVGLHNAWQKTLDSSELNKRFFQEIANWYFWAVDTVTFPTPDTVADEHAYKAQSVIRLITRLIFCWFIKEKGLLPDEIFNPNIALTLLKNGDCTKRVRRGGRDGTVPVFQDKSAYYKAILQNLFFATLNQEMGKREFRKDGQNFMAHTLYRYKALLKDPDTFLALLNDVPFLNGGLFECLDKTEGTKEKPVYIRMDGFSDRKDNPLYVPDVLFFGEEHTLDLNNAYGTANRRYTVRGIIHTLNRYKFTIEENTPIEEEIALDPELLGRVFENLLAAYNPETGATARKQTGSFYTPREIVNYMVDEALIARLSDLLQEQFPKAKKIEDKLRHLFAYNQEPHQFNEEQAKALIAAIDNLKILDPACGSGAFPMGVIHKLVFILSKLDPNNEHWMQRQIERVADLPDPTIRDVAIADIEKAFQENALDYGRKLYLIENCIYGVDIQPVAVQIAKLRFLISLIVDQQTHPEKPNLGLRPLPNLETKIVAANTLIPISRLGQLELRSPDISEKEASLKKVRNSHFSAKTPGDKRVCREQDKALRNEVAALLIREGWPDETANKLAAWDPYNPNIHADFFDSEWMFQITDGFDVVIGNPPFISHDKIIDKKRLESIYGSWEPFADIYCYFIECAYSLLKINAVISLITSNSYIKSDYGKPIRKLLCNSTTLLKILNIEDSQMFESAIVNVAILVCKKKEPYKDDSVLVINSPMNSPDFGGFIQEKSFSVPVASFQNQHWALYPKNILDIKYKIESIGKTLEKLDSKIRLGLATGANYAFIIDEEKRADFIKLDKKNRDLIKPIIRGEDIQRYSYKLPGLYILLTKNGVDVREYPAIYEYLESFGDNLRNRGAKGKEWWNLRACAFFDDFKREKIVWIELTDTGRFALCSEEIYCLNSAYFMLCPINVNVKYLLGILNSRLIEFYLSLIAQTSGMGTSRWINNYVKEFPIARSSQSVEQSVIRLVDLIIKLKKDDAGADTTVQENEIDRIVYDIYNLTGEEISVIQKMRQ